MSSIFTMKEIISSGTSDDGSISWVSFAQSNGTGNIVFWGSPEDGYRNINAVKYQKLPVVIEIDAPEDCLPSEYVKTKYGATLSILEHTWIQVNPEH